jgi:hypothetical protein
MGKPRQKIAKNGKTKLGMLQLHFNIHGVQVNKGKKYGPLKCSTKFISTCLK